MYGARGVSHQKPVTSDSGPRPERGVTPETRFSLLGLGRETRKVGNQLVTPPMFETDIPLTSFCITVISIPL